MAALSQILAQLYTITLLFFTILILELVILLRSISDAVYDSGDRPITPTQYLKLIEEKNPASRYDTAAAAAELPLECTVCLSTFEDGEVIRKLKCKHVFHKDCLDTWLQQCSATCPLCRTMVLPEEVDLRYRQRRNPPEYEGSDEELIYLLSALHDMLVTSIDTSSLKKVQEEIDGKVGFDRMVEEWDLEGLKYLEMVIKESLRIHPVAPLLMPHAAIEDGVINGFHISKIATIWSYPEKFIPKRFEGSNIDYRGHDFEFIAFGSRKRSCPDLQLGVKVVRLVVAQLVHCFEWNLPNGMLPNGLDMTEQLGVAVRRAQNLITIPTYRLHV